MLQRDLVVAQSKTCFSGGGFKSGGGHKYYGGGNNTTLFEGDALAVLNLSKDGESSLVSFGHILQDTRRLSNRFSLGKWSFIRCSDNGVAHWLAKIAKFVSDVMFWKEEALEFLLPPLQTDL